MRKELPIVLIAITLCSGTIGYLFEGSELYPALIGSFPFLRMGAPLGETNIFIEIARWSGILFALNVILVVVETVVRSTAEEVSLMRKVRRPDAIAVHGDGVFAEEFSEALPDKVVHSDKPKSFEAPCQVLLFGDDLKALQFYDLHYHELDTAQEVYIALNSLSISHMRKEGLFQFNMADICAELYWRDYPVFSPERIALIGDGFYAESLLTFGLLMNLFSVEGGVEYSLFGDFGRYRSLHTQLDSALSVNGDSLRFSSDPWYGHFDELAHLDRIVVCGEPSENIRVAVQLRSSGVKVPLHVRCDTNACLDLTGLESIELFGTAQQLCTSAVILQQKHHEAGKVCALGYRLGTEACDSCKRQPALANLQTRAAADDRERADLRLKRLSAVEFETCLSCPSFLEEWRGMDEFTRSSNYAVAAHDFQKVRLMAHEGENPGVPFESLTPEARDRLQEIEHIRWCRFHYLNNWSFAPDGKNAEKRTHHYLVPYSQLSPSEQAKDADPYLTLALRRKRLDQLKG